MKEIKFRAPHYDISTNKFSHFDYWGRNIDNSVFKSPSTTNFTFTKDDEQYTGLKDKNGKEIYEGDIVQASFPNYDDFENSEENIIRWINKQSVVEYREHGFWIKDEFFGWEGEGLWNWEDSEIIGNIHENPELL